MPESTFIPRDEKHWRLLAKAHGAINETVNTIQVMQSGSSVTVQQFLSFHVLWPPRTKLNNIDKLQVPIKKVDLENMAKAFKTNKPFSRNFEAYLQSIKDESDTSGKLGVFQGTRKCQLEADQRIPKGDAGEMSTSVRMSRTPDPESQEGRTPAESITATSESNATPAAEQEWLQSFVQTPDEQCVNMALISFLDAVSLNLPDYKCKWGIARLAFKVDFHRASMEARTDGYLYGPTGGDEAFAIVETKAHQRKKTTKTGGQVYMQESAEMVAWILKDESEERKVPLDNQ